MSSNDDFLSGMKSEQDRDKEWTDAAEYYVKLRQGPPEDVQPLPEAAKEASVAGHARTAWNFAKSIDPTGISPVATSGNGGLAATLAGAALMGGGTALLSRGKSELGGKSQIEHDLDQAKQLRQQNPEPKSFLKKVQHGFQDTTASLASTARKHPIKASLFGALGGASMAAKGYQLLKGKAK